MRILITGGTGFIGNALVQRLLPTPGNEICVITRNPAATFNSKVLLINADLNFPRNYFEKVKTFAPEVVFHFAWNGIPDFSPALCFQNLQTSINFLNLVEQIGSCKKVIVAGSCFELNQPAGACDFDYDARPSNYFSWAKNSLREYAEILFKNKEINLAWFRIFFSYGPGQRKESLIPSIITDLKNNRLPKLRSPLSSHDFIYIDDLVDLLQKATLVDFKSGIYNASYGSSVSVMEVLKICMNTMLHLRLSHMHMQDGIYEAAIASSLVPPDYWGINQKTVKTFNWSPNFDIRSGIRETILKF